MDQEFMQMHENWKHIVGFGPRMMGSDAAKACSCFLEAEMAKITSRAFTESYDVEVWEQDGWQLSVEGAEGLKSCLFLDSGASAGFEGTLEWLGKNRLWNMYSWDRYGVTDREGKTAAYVTVRGNGEAIPQMLFTGGDLPHYLVGLEEGERIRNAAERKAKVAGWAKTRRQPGKCRNVVGSLEGGPNGKKIVISGHYDTVYNTPGAYDNAAGAAVVLEIGRRLKKDYQLNAPIELLLTDGEEFDLAGARNRAEKESKDTVSMNLCIDGVGREKVMEVWSGPESFERRIGEILKEKKDEFETIFLCPPPPGSDQEAYYAKGIPSCMLTFNDQGILHSPKDVYSLDKLENMKVMVRTVMLLLEGLKIAEKKR